MEDDHSNKLIASVALRVRVGMLNPWSASDCGFESPVKLGAHGRF